MEIGNEKEVGKIRKEVRQIYALSPVMINLYIEEAINKLKTSDDLRVQIQGESVSIIRFADDIVLLGENEKTLEEALRKMVSILKDYTMKINRRKTKIRQFCI